MDRFRCKNSHQCVYAGLLEFSNASDGERYIYVRDGKSVEVEAIGTFRLLLRTSYFLDLRDTYVVPSFR